MERSEEVPIGEGVTDQTSSLCRCPHLRVTSTPNYPSVATIAAFTTAVTPGAFVTNSTKGNLNTSIVATNENLTSAISDLNLVATSTKDATIQDKDMRIVGGGTISFISSGTGLTQQADISFDGLNPAFVSIPGLANNINQLPQLIRFTAHTGSGNADQVASIPIRRNGTTTTVHTVTISDTASYAPSRDKIVIARRVANACYIGVNGSMRYLAGEAAPLDGNLSLFGFKDGQIPLQLRLAEANGVAGGIGASIADAEVEFNLSAGGGNPKTLNLSITGADGAARIMRFPGASLDFTNGKILRSGTTNTNWLGRANGAEGTEFATVGLTGNQEVWYAISVEADSTIVSAGVDPGGTGALATEIRAEDVGKVLGRIVVSAGEAASIGAAVSASFGAGTPIGQIKIQSTASVLQPVDDDNIIQLGASGGGGGGGAGDASQSINDFINRLNLSTFNYFTPIVGSVFSTRNQIDEADSTSGIVIGNNGIQLLAGIVLQSNQLLDEEYLGENVDGIQLVEIDAEWGVDNDGSQRIDPNAIWQIRKQNSDSFVPFTEALASIVQGYINNTADTLVNGLVGVNLTNIDPMNSANRNIFFAENHGLETGQRVRFTLGNILGSTLQNPDGGDATATTNYYIHRISSQAFSLHRDRVTADAGTTRLTITSALAPVGFIANLPAGVLPRVGTTNAVRGTHTFTSTVTPANLDIRIRVTGDSQAATRSQSDDGLLVGFAMFYDQDGADVDSVPRTLDNVAEILRSNHLSNTETTTAGYGVAGRGIVLKDTAGVDTELSIGSNDKIRLDGVELSTGHIIENAAGTDLTERANLQFIGAAVTDDSANDRTVVTVDSFRRLTQTGGINSAGDGASAASQSSFHWIAPTGVSSIKVWLTSAGGTGGVGPNPTARPGGGAGGGTIITTLQVVAGQRYELLIADTNPGISDAGGSGRGGRNGGATVFRSPSGSTTALIDGKNRELLVSGGSGGGRSGAGAASDGGRFSSGTNTGAIDTTSTAVNFQVEVNAIGGKGAASGVSPGNNPQGGGSFYETGGPLRQHDGNERGSGGAGFLGFPGGEAMGGAAFGGRGGIFLEYTGPASTIATGLTP